MKRQIILFLANFVAVVLLILSVVSVVFAHQKDMATPLLTQVSNLALDKPTHASSHISGTAPDNAVDGNTTTFWANVSNDVRPWI